MLVLFFYCSTRYPESRGESFVGNNSLLLLLLLLLLRHILKKPIGPLSHGRYGRQQFLPGHPRSKAGKETRNNNSPET